MTRIPKDEQGTAYYEAAWDAWNRLVGIKTPAGATGSSSGSGAGLEVAYAYDGLTRRITRTTVAGTNPGTVAYYWNSAWKCLAEYEDGSSTPARQYVYGARGRNDLILRDEIGVRHYALCDAMGSKTAITGAAGEVVERYAYSAFGELRVLTPAFQDRTKSLYGWSVLFHGEMRDADTGYYNYAFRYYGPKLGRWVSRDPIEERGGLNLYGFVGNNGLNRWDYVGLMTIYYEVVKNRGTRLQNWCANAGPWGQPQTATGEFGKDPAGGAYSENWVPGYQNKHPFCNTVIGTTPKGAGSILVYAEPDSGSGMCCKYRFELSGESAIYAESYDAESNAGVVVNYRDNKGVPWAKHEHSWNALSRTRAGKSIELKAVSGSVEACICEKTLITTVDKFVGVTGNGLAGSLTTVRVDSVTNIGKCD